MLAGAPLGWTLPQPPLDWPGFDALQPLRPGRLLLVEHQGAGLDLARDLLARHATLGVTASTRLAGLGLARADTLDDLLHAMEASIPRRARRALADDRRVALVAVAGLLDAPGTAEPARIREALDAVRAAARSLDAPFVLVERTRRRHPLRPLVEAVADDHAQALPREVRFPRRGARFHLV